MRKTLLAIGATLALAAAVILPLNVPARPAGAPSPAAQRGEERHPEIRAAMRHLEQAKEALEKSQHDFKGHRVKALEHTNQALEECRKALEAD